MTKPEDYKDIARWGRYMGSFKYYIEEQQMLALKEGAPLNAIYREHDGQWATTDDLVPEHRFHKY